MLNFLKNLFPSQALPKNVNDENYTENIQETVEDKSVKNEESERSTLQSFEVEETKNIEVQMISTPDQVEISNPVKYNTLKPYDPLLDLRDYKYPPDELFNENISTYLAEFKKSVGDMMLPVLWSLPTDSGELVIKDLTDIKNIICIGSQATGKSSFLHQIIISLLYVKYPSQLKLVLADSKKVELSIYASIQSHFLAKLPGMEDAIIGNEVQLTHTLNAACIEMDNRFDLLKEAGTRNIKQYNEKFISRKLNPRHGHQYLPFIVIVIDDLGTFVKSNIEILPILQRLILNGYKVGMINILTSDPIFIATFKSELISTIHQKVLFACNNKKDYKTVFPEIKEEIFLNPGHFLFNEGNPIIQGETLQTEFDGIGNLVDFIGQQRGYPQPFLLPEYIDESDIGVKDFNFNDKDFLFEDAARLIVTSQVGSTSLLQRRMKLGYNRAGLLMDQLEAAGVVGGNLGSKARDVLIKTEAELQMFLSKFD